MKILLLILFLCISCQNQPSQKIDSIPNTPEVFSNKVSFMGMILILNNEDLICVVDSLSISNHSYIEYLENNTKNTLPINLELEENPTITNGLFILGLETEFETELFVELFDKDGFSVGPNCWFEISLGNNYKAIDVSALKAGTYTIIIKDIKERKIVRKLALNFLKNK